MRPAISTLLTVLFLIGLVGTPLSCNRMGALPSHTQILPALLQEPLQGKTDRPEFSFLYESERYRVKPVASYELWGLVVGHNDIGAIWDIYHTAKAVDTKDLGVVWGKNLANDEFHKVTYWSGSWTINWSYPAGVTFDHTKIANNHIISDNAGIRRKVDTVRIGDQIHFKGILVNYQASSNPDFWRNSSLTRTDTAGTACEVVFLDSIEVLKAGTPFWYFFFSLCKWFLGIGFLGKLILLFFPD